MKRRPYNPLLEREIDRVGGGEVIAIVDVCNCRRDAGNVQDAGDQGPITCFQNQTDLFVEFEFSSTHKQIELLVMLVKMKMARFV
jgi:hypothetical protein